MTVQTTIKTVETDKKKLPPVHEVIIAMVKEELAKLNEDNQEMIEHSVKKLLHTLYGIKLKQEDIVEVKDSVAALGKHALLKHLGTFKNFADRLDKSVAANPSYHEVIQLKFAWRVADLEKFYHQSDKAYHMANVLIVLEIIARAKMGGDKDGIQKFIDELDAWSKKYKDFISSEGDKALLKQSLLKAIEALKSMK